MFEFDTGITVTPLELRDRDDLQSLERAFITCCAPSLNVSRGGIRHLMSPHPMSPKLPISYIIERPQEQWPFTKKLTELYSDAYRYYMLVPDMYTGQPISNQAMSGLLRHANRGSLYRGVLPTLAIGSDITHESFKTDRLDMGYSDRFTGPGPRVTDQSRLMALGLNHKTPGNTNITLNAFVDFWCLTLCHDLLWIPILQMIRVLHTLRPVLIRPCSSKLCNLFVTDMFADILAPVTSTNRPIHHAFFNGTSPKSWKDLNFLVDPEFKDVTWKQCQSYQWAKIVGQLVIVPVGSRWVLALPDYDGGILKYDPRIIGPLANLKKIIAIKGVVAEEVILKHLERHGDPNGDLNILARLRTRINDEYKNRGIETELSRLKVCLKEMYTSISSTRIQGSWKKIMELEVETGMHEQVGLSSQDERI